MSPRGWLRGICWEPNSEPGCCRGRLGPSLLFSCPLFHLFLSFLPSSTGSRPGRPKQQAFQSRAQPCLSQRLLPKQLWAGTWRLLEGQAALRAQMATSCTTGATSPGRDGYPTIHPALPAPPTLLPMSCSSPGHQGAHPGPPAALLKPLRVPTGPTCPTLPPLNSQLSLDCP